MVNVKIKKIVVAPHIDDEVLGCSSILDKDCLVIYCGVEDLHIVSKEERLTEMKSVSELFGFRCMVNLNFGEPNYYYKVKKEFIDFFEHFINLCTPEEIYIPYKSYNQDHCTIHEVMDVVLRPHDNNHFVPKVLVYEEPDCFWGCPSYHVNYFVKVDIDKKLKGYTLHKSQVRPHRSEELVASLSKVRGSMCNKDYAEAFIIKRWVTS